MFSMSNRTFQNFGQSGNINQHDNAEKFLESTGVEELDDAALRAVNGGIGLGTYVSADVLVPDALGILEDVEIGH